MPFLDIRVSGGVPYDLFVYNNKEDVDKRKPRAFFKVVAIPPKEKGALPAAVIYYMYVKPKHRKKGYASFVLEDLKKQFSAIMTQGSASSDSSTDFLKKNGFEYDGDWLIWKS